LSVVLPVCDESASFPTFFAALRRVLESNFGEGPVEVVVINNGSTDDTSGVVNRIFSELNGEKFVTVYREFRWRDYSEAVRRGVLLTRGEYIAWLGVDIEDLGSIGRGLGVLKRANADIVILSKYLGADWRPAKRIIMNRLYTILIRLLDGLWYSDIEGFMIITRKAKPLLDSLGFSRGNTLNLNLIYFAKKLGIRIEEAPFYAFEERKSVFLRALAPIVWLNLVSVLTVHKSFKRFAEMNSYTHTSIRQP